VVTRATNRTDFPVMAASAGGGKIVYEQAGWLFLLDPASGGQSHKLTIGVAADLRETRVRWVKGADFVRNVSLSPSGARAAFEMRGEIVTVPAEKGDPRNLTNTPGAHEREPAWSPDGKTVAYFSDAGGEYQLVLAPQSGKGEVRKVKLTGSGFYFDPVWSRDSKKLLYRDNASAIYWMDAESGKVT